jgi:hypothetical protein
MNTALNINLPISIEKELNELIYDKQIHLANLNKDYEYIQNYEKDVFKGKENIQDLLNKLKEYEKIKLKMNNLNNLKVLDDLIGKCYSQENMIYGLKDIVRNILL